jgi:hypothetical protein
MSQSHHTFISYSRADSEFALRLASDLRAAGQDVWLDQLDILPGERWDREVEQALKECRRMLIIMSPASSQSENVQDEIGYAFQQRKLIIPVLHQPCDIPFRLQRLQYVDFTKDYDRALARLLPVMKGTDADVTRATGGLTPPASVRTEAVNSEPVRNEPIRPELIQHEPVSREPVRSEPVRSEPVRSAPPRPEPPAHSEIAAVTPAPRLSATVRKWLAVGGGAAVLLILAVMIFSGSDPGTQDVQTVGAPVNAYASPQPAARADANQPAQAADGYQQTKAAEFPCEDEATMRPPFGNDDVPMTLVNKRQEKLYVHWLNARGKRASVMEVAPGQTLDMRPVSTGNTFVVTGEGGDCIKLVRAPGVAVIE